jgi:hypothetical protein
MHNKCPGYGKGEVFSDVSEDPVRSVWRDTDDPDYDFLGFI